jgi:signal transduction histidine kinase
VGRRIPLPARGRGYAYVFGRGYVLHNEYGIPSRMLGSLVDLTNLKQVQEELQQTNENLVRINNDLDNFVYTASHDLKAPIINLEGLVKKLARKCSPNRAASASSWNSSPAPSTRSRRRSRR